MNMSMTPEQIWRLADAAAKSGLAPNGLKSTEACFYIMMTGAEIGVPPTTALRTIALVKGKATIGAETMLALALRAGVRIEWIQADAEAARLTMSRDGHAPYSHAFTMRDAQTAGLNNQETWKKYPAALLRARCISGAVRAYCPDVVTGLYTPEEVASFAGADDPTDVRAIPGPAATLAALPDYGERQIEPAATREPVAVDRDTERKAARAERAAPPSAHDAAKAKAEWLDRVGILALVEDVYGYAIAWTDNEIALVDALIQRIAGHTDDGKPTRAWTDDGPTRRKVYSVAKNVCAKALDELEEAERGPRPESDLDAPPIDADDLPRPAAKAATRHDGMPA